MISLVQLLKEQTSKPKAIILAGAPGAGKGSILKDLDLGGLKILNIDDIFIKNLKQANVSLDLKNANLKDAKYIGNTNLCNDSTILDGTGYYCSQNGYLYKNK